ncbi:MAG: hypothetical protein GY757_39840 [bacterium]|nr:hypothetical protein [bacterium]
MSIINLTESQVSPPAPTPLEGEDGPDRITTGYKSMQTTGAPPNELNDKDSWGVEEPPPSTGEEITKFAKDVINKTVNRINRDAESEDGKADKK